MAAKRHRNADHAPVVGSRWAVHPAPNVRRVYELVRIEGRRDLKDYVLRLVEGEDTLPGGYRLGFEMRVERAWFVLRGDVRRAA